MATHVKRHAQRLPLCHGKPDGHELHERMTSSLLGLGIHAGILLKSKGWRGRFVLVYSDYSVCSNRSNE
jgi:hypothetical protein